MRQTRCRSTLCRPVSLVAIAVLSFSAACATKPVSPSPRRVPTAVVLTCVDEPPTKDALRPAYVGTWKQEFRVSQLRRDALPRLAPPGELPDVTAYERYLERIWLDHMREQEADAGRAQAAPTPAVPSLAVPSRRLSGRKKLTPASAEVLGYVDQVRAAPPTFNRRLRSPS